MWQCQLTNIFSVLVFFIVISVTCSFNIEIFNYAVFSRPNGMFGFSVAVHKQHNRGWVLVGAPDASTMYTNVQNGGAVYKCRVDTDDRCTEIPFDTQPNHRYNNMTMDEKSGQWFGATLSSSGSGPVVACAPRYVWFSLLMNRRDPVGTCYVGDGDFTSFEEYSPCRTSNYGYHRQGSCQAGFSAAINSVGDRLYVGAPGSFYWQGQMYSIDAHASFNYTPGRFTQFGGKGAVHQQSLETRPAVFSTREGRQQDDDSYMGYSTIVGDFQGNGEEGVAVGMPRGSTLRGKVLLFTWNLTNYKNITSTQLGSYFGYALAAADVDGDNLLDLIVGAPMHTEANTEGKYDVGRVYVFYQKGDYGSFNKSTFLDGINSRSRFGHALARLGDLNKDGYEDFAVGAPYDGENNNGAVYIFYGSKNGVLQKYGQVIYAESLKSNVPINTFGFSLAGGLDLDDNEYPDMAVGAYDANTAWFFRSRPVVSVDAFVRFHSANKQIDIKQKNCVLPNGRGGTCIKIDFCIKYTGQGVPPETDFNLQYILDTKVPHQPRMGFIRHPNNTHNERIRLYKDSATPTCMTEEVYVKEDIRDKLTQLEAEVKYFMVIPDPSMSPLRDPRSDLLPILDLNSPPSRRDSIVIQKNCGPDNICVPDLNIKITRNVEKYLLDSGTNLEFDVIVSNMGEDSFETTFQMEYPEGVHYKKTEISQGIFCKEKRENRTVTCDIGNPLPSNRIVKFKVIFEPKIQEIMSRNYEFHAQVNSTNPEDQSSLSDNAQKLVIPIWVDSSLELGGKSYPSEVFSLNTSSSSFETQQQQQQTEEDVGPLVTHLYTLKNKGPATVEAAEIYFLWPWQTLGGDDLLYLLEPPHVDGGNVKCDLLETANYKHYALNRYSESIWKRLNIDQGSSIATSSSTATKTSESSQQSHVQLESGTSITGVVGGPTAARGKDTKIDQEVAKSSGDASLLYERRENASRAGLLSSGNINQAGVTISTKSEWITQYVEGKPVTKWTNVTTVRDSSGKILNTTYSTTDDSGFEQQYTQEAKLRPKVVYTSSGSANNAQSSGSDLSISGTNYLEHSTERAYEQQFNQQKQIVVEPRFHEDRTYEVGGGPREGGSSVVSIDEVRRRQEEEERKRLRIEQSEQRRLYELRIKQEAEERRIREEKLKADAVANEEKRLREEQWMKQEEERRLQENRIREDERRRQEQKLREETDVTANEDKRVREEKLRLEQWRKQEEERRVQEDRIREDERRRQEQKLREEEQRKHEEKLRLDEQHRQEEERRRYDQKSREEERRRQEERVREEERLREETRLRQEYESRQYGNARGRVRTGYYDAQGIYHDERATGQGSYSNKTQISMGNAAGGISSTGLEGSIAGNTFRTHTLDLGNAGSGTVVTGNVQGGSAGYDDTQSGYYDSAGHWQSSGQQNRQDWAAGEGQGRQRQEWSTGGQRSSSGSFSGTIDGYSGWDRRSANGQPLVHNDLDHDDVPTDRPSEIRYHRGKRQVVLDPEIEKLLKCVSTKCFSIKCNVGRMRKDDLITFALRSRLDVRSVKNLTTTQPIKLSSMMVAKIVKLPHMVTVQPEDQVLHSHEVFTEIAAQVQEQPPKVVPLWIILLSAIAGTLILLLVILLLYKCGFFRRNRPSSAPERQPLNRNGYHAGDEAL